MNHGPDYFAIEDADSFDPTSPELLDDLADDSDIDENELLEDEGSH